METVTEAINVAKVTVKQLDKLKLNGMPIDWNHIQTKKALSEFVYRVNNQDVFGELITEPKTPETVRYINPKDIVIRLTSASLVPTTNTLVINYLPVKPIEYDYRTNLRFLCKVENNKVIIVQIITLDIKSI